MDVHAEVQRVARALYARGSVHESVALLRGAKARDPATTRYDELLGAVLGGEEIAQAGHTTELDLELVDAWIRQGMLVEALALLGGTSLGTAETGQEWANLLGELLAPVPVDAEETLVEMHRQLLSGGAAVALTLLEDRAKRQPGLPAWALRRLEVLRWMLLDNAKTADAAPTVTGDAPTELAACLREPLNRHNIAGAAEVAQAFAHANPDDADARRTAEALANLVAEIEAQSAKAQEQLRTIPMFGPPAAAMQLRMGNLQAAASVYRRLLEEDGERDELRLLLADVEAVRAALAGQPVADDELAGEATQQVAVPETGELPDDPRELEDLSIPNTAITELPPEARDSEPREESGTIAVRNDAAPGEPGSDEGPTLQTPSADTSAAELEQDGRWAEAEQLYRALNETDPGNPRWIQGAERCRLRRLGYEGDHDVLMRVIVPIK